MSFPAQESPLMRDGAGKENEGDPGGVSCRGDPGEISSGAGQACLAFVLRADIVGLPGGK